MYLIEKYDDDYHYYYLAISDNQESETDIKNFFNHQKSFLAKVEKLNVDGNKYLCSSSLHCFCHHFSLVTGQYSNLRKIACDALFYTLCQVSPITIYRYHSKLLYESNLCFF